MKFLEVFVIFVIRVVERYLVFFVVSVIGGFLVEVVKDGGFIKNIIWVDVLFDFVDESNLVFDVDGGLFYLIYYDNEDDKNSMINMGKISMGCFFVLIFLSFRYYFFFRMEVFDVFILVRIRIDYWSCLVYVDEYLEVLFF